MPHSSDIIVVAFFFGTTEEIGGAAVVIDRNGSVKYWIEMRRVTSDEVLAERSTFANREFCLLTAKKRIIIIIIIQPLFVQLSIIR